MAYRYALGNSGAGDHEFVVGGEYGGDFLAGLQDVPKELYEAADLDGAGPLRQLLHVTLPVMLP